MLSTSSSHRRDLRGGWRYLEARPHPTFTKPTEAAWARQENFLTGVGQPDPQLGARRFLWEMGGGPQNRKSGFKL